MTLEEFQSTPLGSLLLLPAEERQEWITAYFTLPATLKSVASSLRTGAYLRGLTRNYQLSENAPPRIAFIILYILLGELPLRELGGHLSGELKMANDKAQKMAQEIEHDLLAPIAGELNSYLALRKKEAQQLENKATGDPRAAGAGNVLDLKNKPKPPTPPPIPPRRNN